MTRLRLGLGVQMIALLTLFALLLLLFGSRLSQLEPLQFIEWIDSEGPFLFFTALTLLPLLGIPVTPFYLAAGAVFEPYVTMIGTAAALALNHLLAYALGRRTLRPLLGTFLRRWKMPLPEPGHKNALYTALFLKLAPGPPFIVRSYLMAMSGIPLRTYFLVSWPLSMAYAVPAILLGESAMEGRMGLAGITIALMLALGILTHVLRSRMLKRRASAIEERDECGSPH
jgi:uncharacterized membrane protein YdjX (TVP38/TMEM64 family)